MIVSKGEFARLVGRAPSAISAWIADGKLTAPALIGAGHRAKIDVEAAVAQLKLTLDVGQQLAQAQPIQAIPGGIRPLATPANDDAARLMRAKADQAELDLQMSKARAAEQAGRWLVAEAAREAWTTEMAGFIQAVESWLVTTAPRDIATLGTTDPRTIAKALRSGFRDLRQRIADSAAAVPADVAQGEDGDAE